jgi:molybdopterin molybdotransferase
MTKEHDTQRIARLTPVEAVRARIDALVKPIAPREVELSAALGRVLARDVAAGPLPATAIALRDGWAVASDLTTDAGSYAPAPLGAATRIDAGQPLPAGADAVAPVDGVAIRNGRAEALVPVTPGEGVLPAAADCDPQRVAAGQGRRLGMADLAALAAAGIARVLVREPCIRLAWARGGRDGMLDATCGLIGRLIATAGATASGAAAESIDGALQDHNADAVVIVGGTGSGRNDASVSTLARVGRVEVHGVALSPGETAAFGMLGTRPVLLVPGRLDAALAVWLMLGRPMLALLCGATIFEESTTTAVLTRKVASPLGMTELMPVRCRDRKAEPIASGYWPLQAMARADGWILVAADSEGYPAGAEVVVRTWP